jgi:tripartite-type tricarboxylate transporter receptor subunit TctC
MEYHAYAAALMMLSATFSSFAQTYPSRPVRMISPNPAGGANDVVARVVAAKLAELLGAQMVVDNRGGAGGAIGAELAARATPDGYTLLAGSHATHTYLPALQPKLTYDAVSSFTPISRFAVVQNLLVVHPSVPAHNVKELIALAKAKPGTLNYSSAGSGSGSHFAIALFVNSAGTAKQMVHVPYKGGGPAVAATAAGEAHINFGPMPGIIGQVKAGRLRPLGVGGAKRSPTLPDVPTIVEQGVPYQSYGWFGLFAPARTPQPIVARLNRGVVQAVEAADVRQQLSQLGVEPESDAPEAFGRFVREQLELHWKIVREAGIKPD